MIEPVPTKRAVIDIGRKCNVNCIFCYYKHLGDLRKQDWFPRDQIWQDMDKAIARGNNYFDVTGGEGSIYPEICDLIKYALDRRVRTCVITNGLAGETTMQKIIDSGVDDWLISIHGKEDTHDYLVNLVGARKRQVRFLNQLKDNGKTFRFNFVINAWNQREILELTSWIVKWKPRIINFINMNPHYLWRTDPSTKDVVANLFAVESELNRAIPILESEGIGVNLRYYPMCRINEDLRRCVCNDLHVLFDKREWGYGLEPKTFEHFREAGINMSKGVELKTSPCSECDLQNICGGVNKYFFEASDKKCIEAIRGTGIEDKSDFYFYRQHNVMGL